MITPKKYIHELWRPNPDASNRVDFYRFDRNERTTLLTPSQFQDVISTVTPYDLTAYGELEPFYNKIAQWLNLKRSNLLLSSGSDAGIKAIYETYVSEGDEVLITLPNYAMFSAYADMYGAKRINHYYDKDLSLNVDHLIQKININTKLVVVSNPGHAGTVVSEKGISQILAHAKTTNTLVVIDEAYYHFYEKTMIGHIGEYDNLVVVRTFSKAFGLASIRIGLLIANEKLIDELYKVKLVHEISGLAAKIGIYFLDHMEIIDQHVDAVNKGKDYLYKNLDELGYKTNYSNSNFVYFEVPDNIEPLDIKNALEEKKILISGPFLKEPFNGQLRITVGDIDQMKHFCEELKVIIKNMRNR